MILLNSLQSIHMPYFTIEFSTTLISIMNSYYDEIEFINSDWIQWILISEFIYLWIHIWIQNLYIWIHIHDFIYSWIHILAYMNLNSYMILSYMNSYASWVHVWLQVYQGSRYPAVLALSRVSQPEDPQSHESQVMVAPSQSGPQAQACLRLGSSESTQAFSVSAVCFSGPPCHAGRQFRPDSGSISLFAHMRGRVEPGVVKGYPLTAGHLKDLDVLYHSILFVI